MHKSSHVQPLPPHNLSPNDEPESRLVGRRKSPGNTSTRHLTNMIIAVPPRTYGPVGAECVCMCVCALASRDI